MCRFQGIPPKARQYDHSVFFLAGKLKLPPSPPPAEAVLLVGVSHENKCCDLNDIGFPSLDDEVACFTSQPLSGVACDIPLPPSPPAADGAGHLRGVHEEKHPDLSRTWFCSLDDAVPN